MLGEHAPWIVALSLFSGFFWIFFEKIDAFLRKKMSDSLHGKIIRMLQWSPIGFMVLLFADRINDAITLEFKRNEVAQYLTVDSTMSERLQVALNGQGAVEIGFVFFLLLALTSHHLPSVRRRPLEIRHEFRLRMMKHAGFWMLLLAIPMFPDTMYLPLKSGPTEPVFTEFPSWTSSIVALMCGFCLSLSGELWTSYSMSRSEHELNLLVRNARLKSIVFLSLLIQCSRNFDTNHLLTISPHYYKEIGVVLLAIYLFMCATFVSDWRLVEKYCQNQHTGHQLMYTVCGTFVAFLTIASLSFGLEHYHLTKMQFLKLSFDLFSWVFFFAIVAMGLPPLGFDSSKAPEIWWFRFVMLFTLPIVFLVDDHAYLFVNYFIALGFSSLFSQLVGYFNMNDEKGTAAVYLFLYCASIFIASIQFGFNISTALIVWGCFGCLSAFLIHRMAKNLSL